MGNSSSGANASGVPPSDQHKLDEDLDRDLQHVEDEFAKREEDQARLAREQVEREEAERAQLTLKPKKEMSELERLRAQARADAQDARETGIETLAITQAQIEQTRNDNKKLHKMNETLTEAEKHLKELERGMFNITGSGAKCTLPAKNDDDEEIEIQMWKNMLTRYHHYKLRFTHGCVMRINHKNDLKDTAAYKQIDFCYVKKDENFVEMVFEPDLGVDKWVIYCEDVQHLCQVMVQRQWDAGHEMKVKFEAGATRFDCEPHKSKEDLQAQFDKSKYSKHQPVQKKSNMWGTKDAEHEQFMDDMLGELDIINDIAVHQKDAFKDHMHDLEVQKQLVDETKGRVKVLTKRAKEAERNM